MDASDLSDLIENQRVAIIHDWLVTFAGAEKVLVQMLHLFPQADIFTIVDFLPEAERQFLANHQIITSFVQKLPFARKHYRHYLPLMPLAVEQFDLSDYDLVISSSHAVAKGVITGPHQLHICYVHSPMRYAWDLQHQYLRESGLKTGLKALLVKYLLHRLRIWDSRTANGVDVFLANSQFIAKRVWKVYRRKSQVIYPPVDMAGFTPVINKQDYFLTASRLVPYKKIDLIIEAFKQLPNQQLRVIGDGPDGHKLTKLAEGYDNIQLLGYQPFERLKQEMQGAKAFVFAAEEDFGITPVEAMACGTPVIAFGRGGALETVVSGETGIFFTEQTVESLLRAISVFEQSDWSAYLCRQRAETFSEEVFARQMTELVTQVLTQSANSSLLTAEQG